MCIRDREIAVEFLQLLLVLVAVILIMYKPKFENLAFGIVVFSWLFMMYFYVGHKSAGLLTMMNL